MADQQRMQKPRQLVAVWHGRGMLDDLQHSLLNDDGHDGDEYAAAEYEAREPSRAQFDGGIALVVGLFFGANGKNDMHDDEGNDLHHNPLPREAQR